MGLRVTYTIAVDREVCMGAGVCAVQASSTFDLDDEAIATVVDLHGDPLERIQAAAEGCPTRAISVVISRGGSA